MTTGKVSVERHVEQVRNGSHYKGYVKIANTKFDYELVFGVPIAQLDSVDPAKYVSEFRHLFQLAVRLNDTNIELTKEEYSFFVSMVVELAGEFYYDAQTRSQNEGFIGTIIRGEGPMAGFASASIGMTTSGSYDFSRKHCEMLSTPKFGCALVA